MHRHKTHILHCSGAAHTTPKHKHTHTNKQKWRKKFFSKNVEKRGKTWKNPEKRNPNPNPQSNPNPNLTLTLSQMLTLT